MERENRLRVLVVEDDYMQAQALGVALGGGGFGVVGPVGSVDGALELVDSTIDAAILDIHLGDGVVTPVAEALAALDVPFAFVTAYSDVSFLPGDLGSREILRKPVERSRLLETVRRLTGSGGPRRAEGPHPGSRPADPAGLPQDSNG